jgi:DNA-binding response OmpR family regulator
VPVLIVPAPEREKLAALSGPTFARVDRMRTATRILVVDDEPNARSALTELLRDEGYEVSSAVDGLAAQACIADFHPDLVLTDVHMKGLDGLGLLAELRAKSDAPAVVLMSARPRPRDDGTPFVGKPIDIDKLIATVEATLAHRPD